MAIFHLKPAIIVDVHLGHCKMVMSRLFVHLGHCKMVMSRLFVTEDYLGVSFAGLLSLGCLQL